MSPLPQHFKVHDAAYPHFITCTVIYWIPVFSRDDYLRILINSLNYCCKSKGLSVHGYVLMPNHFHAVLSHPDGKLSQVIGDMKKFTCRAVAEKLELDHRNAWLSAMRKAAGQGGVRLWDEAFHPEQVHSQAFFEQKLAYMHNNPLRAGFVDDPAHWKYSSAGFYYCDMSPVVPITVLDW